MHLFQLAPAFQTGYSSVLLYVVGLKLTPTVYSQLYEILQSINHPEMLKTEYLVACRNYMEEIKRERRSINAIHGE